MQFMKGGNMGQGLWQERVHIKFTLPFLDAGNG